MSDVAEPRGWQAELRDRVHKTRFHMARDGGYDVVAVDEFLTGIEQRLAIEPMTDAARTELLAMVGGARFRMVKRYGYAPGDVDQLLDDVRGALG